MFVRSMQTPAGGRWAGVFGRAGVFGPVRVFGSVGVFSPAGTGIATVGG